jgi:dolichol-phosphate mannosyltransferase
MLDAPSRRWLRRPEPYAAALLAAVVFSPVIVWNAQHEWASFVFQTSRRLAERPRFSLHKLIGGAMVLITPIGVAAVVPALAGRGGGGRAGRLLQLALLVPLTVFFFFSLRHEVKLDWTGAPWVAALPLLAHALAGAGGDRSTGPRGWLRVAWPPTIAVVMLFYGVGWWYLVPGLPGVGYSSQTELVPVAWRDLGSQVNEIADGLRAQYGDALLVIGMDRYAIASEVAFYSPDQSRSVAATSTSHLFGGVGLMYERWFPAGLQAGRPLLLVGWNRESLDTPLLREHLDSLEPIEEGSLTRNGFLVRHFYHRVAHGYDPGGKSAAAR